MPAAGKRETNAARLIRGLLAEADIRVDGDRPWDMRIHDRQLFGQLLAGGSLALGEAYMDGRWDCRALDQFFEHIFRARLDEQVTGRWRVLWPWLRHRLFNLQNRRRAFVVGERHYDAGNDLFERMLDRRMVYSCGYWKDAADLDQAQEAKLDLICRKLELEPGMRLLDIGCGWGGLVCFAAEHYGVEAVGVTVSKEQARLAAERAGDLPVDIRLRDYREIDEVFDRVASVGMVEHVGWRNYRIFMQTTARCLKPGGRFLLHTIGSNRSVHGTDPWIGKYIFPNSNLPALAQLTRAAEGQFVLEDLHSFGPGYDRTLMAWHENFERRWPEIADRYGERFYRMWRYYLLSCAAAFRVRHIQLWQLLLVKQPGGQVPKTIR